MRRVRAGTRQGAHGIEEQRVVVMQLFGTARQNDVLLPGADPVRGLPDGQRRCGARGRRRIADAADAEDLRKIGGHRAAHRLRNDIGWHAVHAA